MSSAKKRSRSVPSPAVTAVDADARQHAYGPRWKWKTFPVVAAFVFGALIASFLDRPDTDFAVGVRIALVIAAAGCMAHMFVAYVIVPRRMAARGMVPRVEEEAEEAYEDPGETVDELVFEDEG